MNTTTIETLLVIILLLWAGSGYIVAGILLRAAGDLESREHVWFVLVSFVLGPYILWRLLRAAKRGIDAGIAGQKKGRKVV